MDNDLWYIFQMMLRLNTHYHIIINLLIHIEYQNIIKTYKNNIKTIKKHTWGTWFARPWCFWVQWYGGFAFVLFMIKAQARFDCLKWFLCVFNGF